MNINQKFNEGELARVKQAVREAENKISGEIVPVIVERSGVYYVAAYRAGIISASLAFLAIIIFDRYVTALAIYDPLLIFIIVSLVGISGALLAHFVDFIKRIMLSQEHMDTATKHRAEAAFLQEEVFNTRHRTGIMIFISFFEHEVIIMADRGISKIVDQREWDRIVLNLIGHIREQKIVEGIELAVKRCGEILLEKGFQKTADDINELSDDLRIN